VEKVCKRDSEEGYILPELIMRYAKFITERGSNRSERKGEKEVVG
jgi:hypothetical protein